ncbi:MAG: PadR family transcriptional regulator [Pyrinomonadaceae bacterium]|nr:PadR family transcriptional regulator [Pyrinomonadaceae bacterium]
MTLPKDLVAASATPFILSILEKGDSYGYAIMQEIRKLSDGRIEWAEGMLYPILHRLDKKGLIESYWGKAETGRRRKYYRLKKKGLLELNEQRQNWKDLFGILEKLEKEYV